MLCLKQAIVKVGKFVVRKNHPKKTAPESAVSSTGRRCIDVIFPPTQVHFGIKLLSKDVQKRTLEGAASLVLRVICAFCCFWRVLPFRGDGCVGGAELGDVGQIGCACLYPA
jgi:hypothetical protein